MSNTPFSRNLKLGNLKQGAPIAAAESGAGSDWGNDDLQPQQRGANPRRRNALGRGLEALLSPSLVSIDPALGVNVTDREVNRSNVLPLAAGTSGPTAEPQAVGREEIEGVLLYLPIEKLYPNPTQPRRHFEPTEIEELAQSIRETGMLQPILLRKRRADGAVGGAYGVPFSGFEIVAGERRWRAAKMAGLAKVPAILKHLTDRQTLELSIIGNVQRADLNPLEEAEAYHRLISEHGATQEQVAQSVGKDRASIANTLRLLKLPEQIRHLVITRKLTSGHARALLALGSEQEQITVAEQIVAAGLSVRSVEQLVNTKKTNLEMAPPALPASSLATQIERSKSPPATDIEERLRRIFGTKVKLKLNSAGRGELRISFFSKEELHSLLEHLGAK